MGYIVQRIHLRPMMEASGKFLVVKLYTGTIVACAIPVLSGFQLVHSCSYSIHWWGDLYQKCRRYFPFHLVDWGIFGQGEVATRSMRRHDGYRRCPIRVRLPFHCNDAGPVSYPEVPAHRPRYLPDGGWPSRVYYHKSPAAGLKSLRCPKNGRLPVPAPASSFQASC